MDFQRFGIASNKKLKTQFGEATVESDKILLIIGMLNRVHKSMGD